MIPQEDIINDVTPITQEDTDFTFNDSVWALLWVLVEDLVTTDPSWITRGLLLVESVGQVSSQ